MAVVENLDIGDVEASVELCDVGLDCGGIGESSTDDFVPRAVCRLVWNDVACQPHFCQAFGYLLGLEITALLLYLDSVRFGFGEMFNSGILLSGARRTARKEICNDERSDEKTFLMYLVIFD